MHLVGGDDVVNTTTQKVESEKDTSLVIRILRERRVLLNGLWMQSECSASFSRDIEKLFFPFQYRNEFICRERSLEN